MKDELRDIRTATISQKGQICIPNIARNLAGFKEGTKISVSVYSDRIELKPLKNEKMKNSLFCMLASEEALAKNWLSKEDEEAWKNL